MTGVEHGLEVDMPRRAGGSPQHAEGKGNDRGARSELHRVSGQGRRREPSTAT
jgi:hypothetical protein